jgi:hypothetical protein
VTFAISAADRAFREDFEAGRVTPAQFDHRAHIRLAYVLLADANVDSATAMMRSALQRFISRHGIPAEKFHETLTRAWVLAVRHFMERSGEALSADAFIEANPAMLDSRIMLSHYSATVLFSPEARSRFVEPDLEGIPRYR